MSFRLKHRYGDYDDIDNIDETTARDLLDELIEEQFDEPDLEHQQVAVRHEDGAYFTVFKVGYGQIEPADFSDHRRWYKPYHSINTIIEDIRRFAEKSIALTEERDWVSDPKALKLPNKSPLF